MIFEVFALITLLSIWTIGFWVALDKTYDVIDVNDGLSSLDEYFENKINDCRSGFYERIKDVEQQLEILEDAAGFYREYPEEKPYQLKRYKK